MRKDIPKQYPANTKQTKTTFQARKQTNNAKLSHDFPNSMLNALKTRESFQLGFPNFNFNMGSSNPTWKSALGFQIMSKVNHKIFGQRFPMVQINTTRFQKNFWVRLSSLSLKGFAPTCSTNRSTSIIRKNTSSDVKIGRKEFNCCLKDFSHNKKRAGPISI